MPKELTIEEQKEKQFWDTDYRKAMAFWESLNEHDQKLVPKPQRKR